MDPAELLWRDGSLFRARHERNASAYLALAGALDRHRPLGGREDEFLGLHAWVRALDPAVFTTVWTDPYAHHWVRLAYGLGEAVFQGRGLPKHADAFAEAVGSTQPSEVLARHLAEFKRLAIGAALEGNLDLRLQAPLEAELPMAIPGTRWSLEGSGSVEIRAVSGGRLQAASGAELELRACPVARIGDFELPLQPYGFRIPGQGWIPGAGHTDLDFQASQVPLVEAAFGLVKQHQPATFEQMRKMLRWIGINPADSMGDDSFASDSNLPGVFSALGVRHPHVIASTAIHEFHHNRMFFLEDAYPFLEGEALGTEDDASYYSPWREEPRPVRGILHALYVYVPEGRFWLSVALAEDSDDAARRIAFDRVVRVPLQLELGILQLETHGRFTPDGLQLFEQIKRDARILADDVVRAGLPSDAPATYIELDGSVRGQRLAGGDHELSSRELIRSHWDQFGSLGRAAPALASAVATV